MQQITEKHFYEEVTREIDGLIRIIDNPNPGINRQDAVIALHHLFLVFAAYPSQVAIPDQADFITRDLLDALHRNRAFWQTTQLSANMKSHIQVSPALVNFSGMMLMPEHHTAFLNLKSKVNELSAKPTMLRAKAYLEIPSLPTTTLHKLLTDTAAFELQARNFSFDTSELKNSLHESLLEHWLNHSILEIPFDDAQIQYLGLINAAEREINKKSKEFAARAQQYVFEEAENVQTQQHAAAVHQANIAGTPVPPAPAPLVPPKPVNATLFNNMSPKILSDLRVQALQKFLHKQTDVKVVKGLANFDTAVLGAAGITNTTWMTLEQKTEIKRLAQTRLDSMEQDLAVKNTNHLDLNAKVAAFLGKPNNTLGYSNAQSDRLNWLFDKLSVTQQQNFLNKIDDDGKFLAKVFHATSEEALRHYVGVKSNEAPNIRTEISLLLAVNRHGVLISGELNKYLLDLDPNNPLNEVAVNNAIKTCYANLVTPVHGVPNNNAMAIARLELALGPLGFPVNNNDPKWIALGARLVDSATLYNAIKNENIYTNNPDFCNYLLSIPGFSSNLNIQLTAGNPDDTHLTVAEMLLDIFNKSHDKNEFLVSVATSPYSGLADDFADLQETEFTELKNKTRQEDLKRAFTPANPDEKLLKEILRKDTKEFIEPLAERFLNMQQLIVDNTQKIADVRNAIRLDQFTPQHASSGKARELKKNLTDMVNVLDKMDSELGVQHAQWQGYKDALVAGGSGVVSDVLADRIELVDKYIADNQRTRVALQEFREKKGLLSIEEARSKDKGSVLLSIQSVEEKSQKHGAVKFAFTGSKTTIKAVAIGTPPPAVSQRDMDGDLTLGERTKSDLTKKDAYMPVLPEGHMYRMEATYLKEGTTKTETVSIKKEGNKVTLEQKPAPEGELEAIMKVVEWKLENHQRGNPIIFNGDAKLVAKCVEVCLALTVPLEMIEMGHETAYRKKDRGNLIGYGKTQDVKDAQEFVKTPDAKERIKKSLSRLKAYRPEARETFLTEKAEESSNKSKNLADDYKMYKKKNQETVEDEADEEYRPRTPKPGANN